MMQRFQHVLFLFLLALFLPHTHGICAAEEPIIDSSKATSVMAPPGPDNDFAIPDENSPESHFFSDFLNMLMTLGMLIGLLLFVSWFLKRMMRTRVQQLNTASSIKIIEQRPLSTKSTIHFIEIEGKYFAIGETHNNLVLIGEFPSFGEAESETTPHGP